METLRVTREKNALQASLKELRRVEVQELCRIHNIVNVQRTKLSLEQDLVNHFVNEHQGRVIQISKCDKTSSVLGSSAANRPLVPQKRQADLASSQPASKRSAASNAATQRPASVQAVRSERRPAVAKLQHSQDPTSASLSNAHQLQTLQSHIDAILARLDAHQPQPQSTLTEEHVITIIEERLAAQRKDFAQALDQLQELCQTGFTSIQSSFDAVDSWKEEVTETFIKIQDWATEVEQKIIAGSSEATQDASRLSKRYSQLSSTPSSLPASSWQTPAVPTIARDLGARRFSRISDAVDLSLATIHEQPNSPLPQDVLDKMASSSATVDKVKKKVRISSPVKSRDYAFKSMSASTSTSSPAGESLRLSPATENIETGSNGAEALAETEVTEATSSSPAVTDMNTFGLTQNTCTPMAAKTLFGTERSTEERFDDIVDIMDNSDMVQSITGDMPAWSTLSPTRLLIASAEAPSAA